MFQKCKPGSKWMRFFVYKISLSQPRLKSVSRSDDTLLLCGVRRVKRLRMSVWVCGFLQFLSVKSVSKIFLFQFFIRVICACHACPVAPADGTGVAPGDRTGVICGSLPNHSNHYPHYHPERNRCDQTKQ